MVTPMQEPQEGEVRVNRRTGERAVRRGGEWVVEGGAPQAAGQPGIPNFVPMETPAQRAQAEERAYDRQRDVVQDAAAARREERAIEANERAADAAQRQAEQANRAGTPESRGRLATAIGPSVLAQDSLARQEVGVNPLNRDWGAAALDAVPDFGILSPIARAWGGQDYQDYNQSLKTVEASLLPVFSGLAVTPQEAQRFIRANQPQLGDSPETLARKARNRQTILNEAAEMLQRPLPYPDIGRYGDEGFRERASQDGGFAPPTVNDGRQVHRADDVLAVAPGEYAADYVARFDRDGDNRASVEEMEEAGWTFDHGAGKWLPPGSAPAAGGGTPPPAGPQGGSGSPLVDRDGVRGIGNEFFRIGADPMQAQADYERLPEWAQRANAFVNNFADMATFGLARKATAGLQSARGQGDYDDLWAASRAQRDQASQDHPVSAGTGMVAGAVASPAAIRAGRWIANAPRLGYAMTRGGATGAGYGAAYGAGEAEPGREAQGAAQGAMTGGIIGGALPPAARLVGGMTEGLTRPVRQGVGDLARRMTGNPVTGEDAAVRSLLRGVNPDEMEARLAEGRNYGVDLTLADVGGSNVQSRTRVAATRQTPGREVAQDFASGRRSEVQDFAAGLGERVSPLSATPQQLDEALEQYQRQASASAFGAVRGDRVVLNRDSVMALRSEEGRAAVRDAARLYASSTDEAERNLAAELNRLADVALDNPAGAEVTVGAADLMARYLNRAGGTDANRNRVFGALGRTIRDDARTQNPGYDEALTDYASRARLGDAVETGERFLGRGHTGDFVQAAGGMDEQQRQIARAAARASIERASETGGSAPGLLDKLATGRGQQQRSAALLGPQGAADLQQGARVGRRMVDTANNVNPRAGSNTYLNAQDDNAQAVGGIVGNLARGRPLSALGGVFDMIRSAGISDEQAETIVRLATDPSRTEDAIRILRTRFPEQEARRIVSQITPMIAGQSGAAVAPQRPQVRMVGPQP